MQAPLQTPEWPRWTSSTLAIWGHPKPRDSPNLDILIFYLCLQFFELYIVATMPEQTTTQSNRRQSSQSAKRQKTAVLQIRLSQRELEDFRAKADAKGMTLSELVRESLSDVPVKARPRPKRNLPPALVRELARIGNNLNQIARWCNRNPNLTGINATKLYSSLINIDRNLTQTRHFFEARILAEEQSSSKSDLEVDA